jgi:uncharacterized protein YabE (DUF348 family)
MLAVCIPMLLVLGLSQTGSPLVVEVDGLRREWRTHAGTVGDALRHTGLVLHPEDIVTPGLETPLRSGIVVRVQRAQPVVLSADGSIWSLRTHAPTVGDLLREAGIRLGPADEVLLDGEMVKPSTPLAAERYGRRMGGDLGFVGTATADGPVDPPVITLRRAASLTLDDKGKSSTLHTTLATVGEMLHQHGVTLFLGDEITPGPQTPIASGMAVQIRRSLPVKIEVDGKVIRTRTLAGTVAGVLGEEGITLVGKDTAQPGLETPLRANMVIRVRRVREEFVVEFEPIPFETVWVPDPEVEIDNIRVVQEGQIGLTKRRYRVVYKNGREVDRFLEDVWAERPPVEKTMAYGTKIVIRTLDTPEGPIEYWRKMRVYTTAYKPASCGKPKDHPRYGYTRLGWYLKKGIVATDPTVIPLRSYLYVPDYGIARAGDTGGGVKGKFVDLGYGDDDYQSWHWWSDIYLMTPVPPLEDIRYVLPDYPRFPDRKRR